MQNSHLGSTLGMFSGIVGLIVLYFIEEFAISNELIRAGGSFECDMGCFPGFVVSIFFGSLAYQLHKRRMCNTTYGTWKSFFSKTGECISILIFIMFSFVSATNSSWAVISIFSSIWILIVYGLLIFKSRILPLIQTKKFIFTFTFVSSIFVILASLWYKNSTYKELLPLVPPPTVVIPNN